MQQNLAPDTEISSFSFKKWRAFSRKNYVILSCLSLIIIVFKVYASVIFYKEVNFAADEKRFVYLATFFLLLTLLWASILATVPVIIILREILTSRFNKKIQQLEEVSKVPQSINL